MLLHSRLILGLFLADQDKGRDAGSPGTARKAVVIKGIHHLFTALRLIHKDKMPRLGIAGAGGKAGHIHQMDQLFPRHGTVCVHPAALPLHL